jgi:hypothetical protein
MSFGLSGVPIQNPATAPVFHTQQKLTPKVEIIKLNDTNSGDALLTANYLRNLSAVANHDKTPHELCGLALFLMSVTFVYLAANAMSC